MKNFFSNILTFAISMIVLFLVLEGVVRLFVPSKYYSMAMGVEGWDSDEVLGWKNKANYEDVALRHGKMVSYKTNEDGFRPATAKREKEQNVIRIMLFGNSTVNAREVPEEETIHYLLDSLLNAAGAQQYEVINAGVLGYATDQALLNMEKYLTIYSPDIACYGYCINDLYANNSGKYSGLYKPHFELKDDSLVFVSLENENTDILEATRSFTFSGLLQYSAFWGLMRPYIHKVKIKFSKQAELDQGGMGEIERYGNPIADEPHFQKLSKLIARMQHSCEEVGSTFVFYPHPEVVTVWPPYREAVGKSDLPPQIVENKLQEIADLDSIRFVGMVDHFLENEKKGPFHLLPNDPHCNGIGYLLQAEVLSDYVLDLQRKSSISLNTVDAEE